MPEFGTDARLRVSKKSTIYPKKSTANLRDSGEHLVAHEVLERELRGLSKNLNRSMDVMIGTVEEIRGGIQELREDSAVTQEKLKHVATDMYVSQAISICRDGHAKKQPINWKGITALVTGIIAAVAAGTVLVIQAF